MSGDQKRKKVIDKGTGESGIDKLVSE